ncbi:MAG TPA: Ig-like domain-containing protein [Longimicrobium sp.]|jgi:hypothetical protein|uniref:Ig-like domain-containing protein n=1 Tax=Longimicrobium sp. TaxID=2029185 RepID=UPI002ED849E4
MLRIRFLPALALASLLALGCENPAASTEPGVPASMVVVSGDMQPGVVAGADVPAPLVVRVVDAKGNPVPDQIVNFVVTAGGGQVFAGAATTNKDGLAQERWTLGTVAGDTQRVEARAVESGTGQALVFARFRAVASPDAAHAIAVIGAAARTGVAGGALGDSLAARVTDRHGNPVPGTPVVWFVAAGGGSISPAQGATDAQGIARAQWTLGTRVDSTHVAEAALSLATRAQFTATVGLPFGATLAKLSGDGQNATAGTELGQPLVVRLSLPDGRTVAGATVTWVAAGNSGSVAPATAVTDHQGLARATWGLGTGAGTQTATATAGTLTTLFAATATAAAPAAMAALGGDGQTAHAGSATADLLAVRITDAFGNPVPGATVSWSVERGGGTAAPAQSLTDDAGVARSRWTLGTRVDSAHAAVAVLGSLEARFTATATVPPTAVLAAVSGNGQSGPVAQQLPEPVVVELRLADGRTIAGAPVTWSVGMNSGILNPVSTVTDAQGRVSARWTLGERTGTLTATAATPGVAAAELTATATSGAATSLVAVSGSGQSGSATVPLGSPLVVRATDVYGNPVPRATISWTASRTSVLTPNPGSTGADGTAQAQWTPKQGGSQTATATLSAGGPAAGFTATVAWAPASITVSPASGTVLIADSVEVTATAFGASGEVLVGAPISWTATEPNAATLRAAGSTATVYGRTLDFSTGPVTTSVQASLEGRTGTALLAVRRPRLEWVDPTGRCGVNAAGTALCPQLPSTQRIAPEIPLGLRAVTRIGAGTDAVCGRVGANAIRCILANGAEREFSYATGFVPYSARCDLNASGQAYCWGPNQMGQAGNGEIDTSIPRKWMPVGPVVGGLTFTRLSESDSHACALTSAGAAYCWGSDQLGQLGTLAPVQQNSGVPASPEPVAVQGGLTFSQITVGSAHSCGITTAGSAYCWGSNSHGQLGTGTSASSETPVAVQAGGVTFSLIAASRANTTCALATDGRAFCWGANDAGQLGNGTTSASRVPVLVSGGLTFKDLGAWNQVSGLTTDGRLFRWGGGVTQPAQIPGQI